MARYFSLSDNKLSFTIPTGVYSPHRHSVYICDVYKFPPCCCKPRVSVRPPTNHALIHTPPPAYLLAHPCLELGRFSEITFAFNLHENRFDSTIPTGIHRPSVAVYDLNIIHYLPHMKKRADSLTRVPTLKIELGQMTKMNQDITCHQSSLWSAIPTGKSHTTRSHTFWRMP